MEIEPEIWRELEVRGDISLAQLHGVLQVAFGWEDVHLHRFTDSDPFAPLRPINGEIPEPVQWLPSEWCEEPTDLPEEEYSVLQLFIRGSGRVFYEYDFGDSWLHVLELLGTRPADADAPIARLTSGARRAPVEDSGEFPGYQALLNVLADPSHPDHFEHAAWVGGMTETRGRFDPEFLDIAAVDQELRSLFTTTT
jgi:hypothetical protein